MKEGTYDCREKFGAEDNERRVLHRMNMTFLAYITIDEMKETLFAVVQYNRLMEDGDSMKQGLCIAFDLILTIE